MELMQIRTWVDRVYIRSALPGTKRALCDRQRRQRGDRIQAQPYDSSSPDEIAGEDAWRICTGCGKGWASVSGRTVEGGRPRAGEAMTPIVHDTCIMTADDVSVSGERVGLVPKPSMLPSRHNAELLPLSGFRHAGLQLREAERVEATKADRERRRVRGAARMQLQAQQLEAQQLAGFAHTLERTKKFHGRSGEVGSCEMEEYAHPATPITTSIPPAPRPLLLFPPVLSSPQYRPPPPLNLPSGLLHFTSQLRYTLAELCLTLFQSAHSTTALVRPAPLPLLSRPTALSFIPSAFIIDRLAYLPRLLQPSKPQTTKERQLFRSRLAATTPAHSINTSACTVSVASRSTPSVRNVNRLVSDLQAGGQRHKHSSEPSEANQHLHRSVPHVPYRFIVCFLTHAPPPHNNLGLSLNGFIRPKWLDRRPRPVR
ncbi:MAG: hypothetical protein Q9210_006877 [Variospora velana]